MAAPIEMPFGSNTWVGPGNHVLDGGSDPLMERGNFEEEKRCPIVKYRDSLWSFVRKQLNQSRCRLDCGLRWSIRIMLDEGPELLTDIAMATNFGMQFAITGFVGHNFGSMTASDTLFDSTVGFGVKLSDEDTAEIECRSVIATATNSGTKIGINWLCVNDSD